MGNEKNLKLFFIFVCSIIITATFWITIQQLIIYFLDS